MKTHSFTLFRILSISIFVLIGSFILIHAQSLKNVSFETKVLETENGNIFYSKDVPKEVVTNLVFHLSQNIKTETYSNIYKIPSSDNLYLVTTMLNDDKGSKYVLFEYIGGELKELTRTALVENTIIDTTFFVSQSNMLIVADVAIPPDFVGLQIYKLTDRKFESLGDLSVAEKIKSTGLHSDFRSPIANATAEFKTGIYYFTFKGSLYTDWGGDESEEEKLSSPASFYYSKRNKSFRPKCRK